jgi:hypothetical protein
MVPVRRQLHEGTARSRSSAKAWPRPPRTELLHVLILPDFERADRIGELWGYPQSRAFAELLIGCETRRQSPKLLGCTTEPEPRWAVASAAREPGMTAIANRDVASLVWWTKGS